VLLDRAILVSGTYDSLG